MSGKRPSDDLDPDYQDVVQPNKRLRSMQQDAKDATVRKIVTIIKDQFSQEIRNKEREIQVIDERIHQARGMLDRLRACIIASYYGGVAQKPNEPPDPTAANHPAIKKLIDRPKAAASANQTEETESSNQSAEGCQEDRQPEERDAGLPSLEEICDSVDKQADPAPAPPTQEPTNGSRFDFEQVLGRRSAGGPSRFCVKKRIIVGNVSKYITADKREENDQSTHKWMVYVRGPREAPRIDHFVKKVWFYLHPSYRPNDLVEISEPPFHLTRRGWGEFPVRVQLHFVDPRHKKVDIIHQLKLDRTYTGLQTLGAETIVDVELDRHLFDETGTPLFPDLSVLSSGLPAKPAAPPGSSSADLQAAGSPVKPSTSSTAPSSSVAAELQADRSPVKRSTITTASSSTGISSTAPSSSCSSELQADRSPVKRSTSSTVPSSSSVTELQVSGSPGKPSTITTAPCSSSTSEMQASGSQVKTSAAKLSTGASSDLQATAKPSINTKAPSSSSSLELQATVKPSTSTTAPSSSSGAELQASVKLSTSTAVLPISSSSEAATSTAKPSTSAAAPPGSSGGELQAAKSGAEKAEPEPKPGTSLVRRSPRAKTRQETRKLSPEESSAKKPRKTREEDSQAKESVKLEDKSLKEKSKEGKLVAEDVTSEQKPKIVMTTAIPQSSGSIVDSPKPKSVAMVTSTATPIPAITMATGRAVSKATVSPKTLVGEEKDRMTLAVPVKVKSEPLSPMRVSPAVVPPSREAVPFSRMIDTKPALLSVPSKVAVGPVKTAKPVAVTGTTVVGTPPQGIVITKIVPTAAKPVTTVQQTLTLKPASKVVSAATQQQNITIIKQVKQEATIAMATQPSVVVTAGTGPKTVNLTSPPKGAILKLSGLPGQSSPSGSHMIVMSSQQSAVQAVPRVVASPPGQGKAVLLSGVTPQVKVEKLGEGKVPVTPTKVSSTSPTVPPGTPPQVRTISGAVIGGLSPVSKPHPGTSAGNVVQVAPQQIVSPPPNVPGGTTLLTPNVMNLPLVNVAPGAKVFLAAKSTDPAMKGKVILIPQTAIVKGIPLQQGGQGSGVTVLQGSPVVPGVNMPAQVVGGSPQGGNIVHVVQGGGLAAQGASPTPTLPTQVAVSQGAAVQVTGQRSQGERSSPGVAQTVKAGSTITLPLQPGTSYILMQQQPPGGASASGNVPGSSPSRPSTLMVQQLAQDQAGKTQMQVAPQPSTKPMQSFRIIPSSTQAGGQSPTADSGGKAGPSVATAGGHTFIALTPQQLSQIGKPGAQQQIGAGQTLLVPVQNVQMAGSGAGTSQLVTKSACTPTVLTPSPSHRAGNSPAKVTTPAKVTSSLQKSILQMKLGSQVTGSRATGTSPTPTFDIIELMARKVCTSGIETKEQLIGAVVRHVPLVDPNRALSQHPYCAQTRQQFFSWNVGKQRAAEWQRSVAVRKVIDKVKSSSQKLTLPTPTTREIMDWSRTHGYTPSAYNALKEDENYCELCGQKLRAKLRTAHEDCLRFWAANGPPSSCSGSADLCQMLEDTKPSQHADDNDLEVDVISLGQQTKVVVKQEPMEEEDDHPRFFLPMSPAAEFVHDTAQKLGVKLEPVETTKDMFSPVLEEMVLKAALLFTNDVIRGALASAYERNNLSTLRHAPPIILPSHIHQSVSSNPSCDFLTNCHMGVVAMEKEESPAS